MKPRIFCLSHNRRRTLSKPPIREPHEPLLTPEESRQRVIAKYGAVNRFAAAHQIHWQIVYDALRGKGRGTEGLAHKARVILGLKYEYPSMEPDKVGPTK